MVRDQGAEPAAAELISYCRAGLTRYKVPAYMLFTKADELPVTVSGKVQKFKRAERDGARLSL